VVAVHIVQCFALAASASCVWSVFIQLLRALLVKSYRSSRLFSRSAGRGWLVAGSAAFAGTCRPTASFLAIGG